MTEKEKGFLLLTCSLGDEKRPRLTVAQFRILAQRVSAMDVPKEERDLNIADLKALGYGDTMADRIVALLEDGVVLDHYLNRGYRDGCRCISRISGEYPLRVRKKLGLDAPGCFWSKGDTSLLELPKVALVGSRDIDPENLAFAKEVGRQAALQGYALVSGNARGADRAAQEACVAAGGRVISVVADALHKQEARKNVLYLSEDGFDDAFSAQRAISRNRVIHSLADATFVAQAAFQTGGTWDGAVKNLRFGWSPVCVFRDGSTAQERLCDMGATAVKIGDIGDLSAFFDIGKDLFEI